MLNFILSWITLAFKERINFLGLERERLRHTVSSTAFLLCALIGSLGVPPQASPFPSPPFWGRKVRGKNRKAKKRLRKWLPDSHRAITNCHLVPNLTPSVSMGQSGFYRSCKQSPEFQPNLVVSLPSTELGFLKADSRSFTSLTNTVVKMPSNRYHVLQNETDPCASKSKTGFPCPTWGSPGLGQWSRPFRIL